MPAQITVDLTPEIRQQPEKFVRSRTTPVRLVQRFKIILLAADNTPNYKIAEQPGLNINTVWAWRNRFVSEGIESIKKDRPRGANHGGKNTRKQQEIRAQIIRITSTEKPGNATHRSTRTLAKYTGISPSLVQRTWREAGLKPRPHKTFKVSNDPRFEEKLRDVVGLYMSPPENALVLRTDEKSSVQASDRTQPGLPVKKGRCETMTHDYKRHGTSTLFAAPDVATGKVIGECMKKHRHQEFLSFLKTV